MGEYARLNKMLREKKKMYQHLKEINADPEEIADCYVAIGEIEGALLEMADIDGLDDPGEAFDY